MALTLAQMARQVKRRLLGSFREPISSLNVAMTDTTGTSVTLTTSPPTLGVDSVLSIDTEAMYVTGWDPSSKIATVIRGYLTDPATHNLNAVVEINSRFPSATIYDAMLDTFNSLPLGIFAATDTGWIASTASGQYLIDITAATSIPEDQIYGILDASIDRPDLSSSWAVSLASATQAVRWSALTDLRIQRVRYPTAADAKKFLIRLGRGGGVQWDQVNFSFTLCTKPVLTTFTPATLMSAIGLPDSVGMPVVLGTMLQLWADQEVKRTARGPAGESRRPEEVPAGLLMSDVAKMRETYDRLVANEADKLRARYPFRWTA